MICFQGIHRFDLLRVLALYDLLADRCQNSGSLYCSKSYAEQPAKTMRETPK